MAPLQFDRVMLADLYRKHGMTEAARIAGCSKATAYHAAVGAGLVRRGPLRGRPRHHGKPLGIPYVKGSAQGYVQWVFRYWDDDGNRRYHYLLEHSVVMSRHLGRQLVKDEVVHHRNGVKNDNRLENLEVLSRRAHAAYQTPTTGRTHCPHCGGDLSSSLT